ncbi:DNA cytosine methyltransferase [Mycobacteroides abscessus]|uniref:DNA cytosine methyltransferase n=1 Tax=Mycobacteroides abscessus TaxID=36809 RepID=UPI00092A56B2|nr:DNA (cytosine-5-)-methyltransferase [Mycobacteroides abscessus]QSM04876.1 DNA methylase [Mycobacterium phage prophi91-4]MDO3335124.1 DNA (cytosine-5-)-methyltransferase [Mycobacteroides abscessus subsp. bolletii]QSM87837.1 DNA cytosine methyltransferase [Mycobacteroides abscessus subsp. bolletii]SIB00930.1 phage DNA methylase [Mycobacteroides abscessus subsp. bolletii]SII70102.1 phage DNA methylase [Mycobacteroides abscessus subsp. bolletii]
MDSGQPRIGSLFSGAGGLDLAVEHVTGGRTVWHCEADPDASKVLAAHWPGVPNLGDITAVNWSQVEAVDILCGGFPCQDVSAAGRRAGIALGTRSGLWLEYAEAINQLRPQLVVIENVRGLLSGYAHRAMEPEDDDLGGRSSRPVLRAAGAVLGDLADLGYDAQWTTIAASEVGAPHCRYRVIFTAHPKGQPWRLNQRDPRCTTAHTDDATRDRQRSRPQPWCGGQDATPNPAGDRRDERGSESTGFIGRSDAAIGGLPIAADTEGDGCSRIDGGASVPQVCGGRERQSAGSVGSTSGSLDLLPTPAASRYPSNRSPSPGASVRPSLDSITDLLPTPGASDGSGGRSASVTGGVRPSGAKRSVPLTDLPLLLPTPKATDAHSSSPADLKRNDPGLRAIDGLLPTPCASDATGGGAHPDSREGHSRQLIDYALLNGSPEWGKYEPAIRRWEAITREAPSPTERGVKGNPRLAARFSEWMQGWPLGWVTAVAISRSAMLRIIGNGVVPQQAVAGLYWLLGVGEMTA